MPYMMSSAVEVARLSILSMPGVFHSSLCVHSVFFYLFVAHSLHMPQ